MGTKYFGIAAFIFGGILGWLAASGRLAGAFTQDAKSQPPAVSGTQHVVFSSSDPLGVYRLSLAADKELPKPLFSGYAKVAANPASQQWVALFENELKVMNGNDEQMSIPSPAGTIFLHRRPMAFSPDGTLYVVLESGRGVEIQSVNLASKEFAPRFVWDGDTIRSMTTGPRMKWKQ